MSPRIALSSILITACLAGTAMGQVAPPPPPADAPQPEFVPPPMPAPRPERPQAPVKPKGKSDMLTDKLPDFPYPALWSFCGTEDPKVDDVCTFEDNLHYMALRPNPMVSPGMLPEIQAVIVARRARLEKMVIDNLQIVEDVDGGLVEEISLADPVALQELLERVKPLNPPSNLTQELQNRKVLSNTQAKFNNKIIGEYQRDYGAYLRRVDPDNSTDRFMQNMFNDSLSESKQAFNGMLHESRTKMAEVLKQVDGVPSDVGAALMALSIDSMEIEPALIKSSAEKVKLAWRPLSLEQKAAFLTAVRMLRPNPDVPQIPVISVEHANKRIIEGKPGSVKVMDNSENIRQMREKAEGEEDGEN